MSGFLFAFLLVGVMSIGTHDQRLIARLSTHFPNAFPVLLAGWLGVALSSAIAVQAASLIAPIMPARARILLVALALIWGAAEIIWRMWRGGKQRKATKMKEPTRSFFATLLVVTMDQIADGARFVLFALAIATAAPAPVWLGGVLAGGAMVTLSWMAGEDALARVASPLVLGLVAGITVLAGLVVGMKVFGLA